MAGRAASKTIAVISLLGAAGFAAAGAGVTTGDFEPTAWRRGLEGRMRETQAALHARVATLAELPRLAAAVSTDAQTVRDLTPDELAFRPRRGETIAMGQLPKQGVPVVLLAFPDQAHGPPIYPIGPLVRIVDGTLVLSEAVRVTPRERVAELDGVVAASSVVDFDDLSRELVAAGIAARIVVGVAVLKLGASQLPSQGHQVDLPFQGPPGAGMRLLLVPPSGQIATRYWIIAAGLGLVTVFFAVRARRAQALVPSSSPPAIWMPTSSPLPDTSFGAPATDPSVVVESTGRRIGRYEILRHIGTGGMAEVYLAQVTGEAGFTKKIALKILEPAFARQPQVVELFLDEARLASLLDHPNIVQIIDLGRADDEYFIAMEYVDGADLARLIEISRQHNYPVPQPVVLAILRKICDGLHAAHTARTADGTSLELVHRDVKCGNVFVARNGVVKVGDFGIALAHHASRTSRTEIGMVKGTPGYMAPEHRLGQPVDGRADLYGVGAIAYELLSGTHINLDFATLALKGKAGWPHLAPLAQFRSDIWPDLEAVVFCALAYDAEARFADCGVLESVLEQIARRNPPIASDKAIAQWIDSVLVADVGLSQATPPPRPRAQDS